MSMAANVKYGSIIWFQSIDTGLPRYDLADLAVLFFLVDHSILTLFAEKSRVMFSRNMVYILQSKG